MVSDPEGLNETIEDVDTSTEKYIGEHYRTHRIVALLLSALWTVGLIIWGAGRGFSEGIIFALLLPVFILSALYGAVKTKMSKAFLRQFAARVGYSYQDTAELGNRAGFPFNIGHDNSLEDFISGQYQGFPVNLFIYSYETGSEKEKVEHIYTVFEITYNLTLPHLFLKKKHENFGESIFGFFKNEKQISLEGDFDKYFTLLAPQGFQLEALQIFTPDFMLKMRDQWKGYNLEFVGNRIYIYRDCRIDRKKELHNMYDLVQHLITAIGPVFTRMQKSVLATVAYYKNQL